MTPELQSLVNAIISGEETMRLLEEHEMNQSHRACLMGFKRFHRYRAMDRGRHSLKLQCFMVESFHTEPAFGVNYMTPSISMSLADSLRFMHDKGLSHLDLLEKSAKLAFEEGESLLGGYLERMICDQSKEVDEYYRLLADVKREGADINFLSHELHSKMKKKEKAHFNFTSDKAYKY